MLNLCRQRHKFLVVTRAAAGGRRRIPEAQEWTEKRASTTAALTPTTPARTLRLDQVATRQVESTDRGRGSEGLLRHK